MFNDVRALKASQQYTETVAFTVYKSHLWNNVFLKKCNLTAVAQIYTQCNGNNRYCFVLL